MFLARVRCKHEFSLIHWMGTHFLLGYFFFNEGKKKKAR